MAEAETQLCNNCKKQISVNNFMMHEVHCKRHISLCEHCKEPIPNGEMEVHFEENHAKIACPKCSVEVEKMNLEDHEENSCKKKPMDCVYCELKFPKDEFEAHIDYCGSRTEQCHKCGQYIKLKDQTQHEDSKCRYPEVKPTNRNRTEQTGSLNGHNTNLMTGMNPFALEELSRVLNIPGGVGPQFAVEHQASPPVVQGTSALDRAKARQNVTVKKAKTNLKSDLNRQRGQQQPAESPKESDYDHLLAMHLAQDLNPDEDLDHLMRAYEKPSRARLSPDFPVENIGQNRNMFTEDMAMIPCEFCGAPFMSDDLVQHQSGCSLDRISDVLPTLISANNRTDGPNNNNARGGERSPVVDPPAIINNLRKFDAEPWLDDTAVYQGMSDGGSGEDLMLPCEFCDELFPMDSLVQHQAICECDTSKTPRVMTPAEPAIRHPKPKKLTPSVEMDFPNLSSRRHQPPPGLLADDDDREKDYNTRPKQYTIGATHRVRKPNTATASKTTDTPSPNDNIRKTMKKYGAESLDRGDYYARQGSHSRQSASSNDTDSWLQPSAQVHKYKPSVGASRTKNTLDSLLDDSKQSSSHDLLGHIGASRQPQRSNASQVNRKTAGPKLTGATGRAQPKTRATAKDVQRELSRSNPTSNNTNHARNRFGQPNFDVRVRPAEADEPSAMLSSQRRNRANHVFGASNSNRTMKKRSDAS